MSGEGKDPKLLQDSVGMAKEMSTKNKWQSGHIPPRPLLGLEDVTIKTKGWIFTFRPRGCCGYDF